MADTDMSDPSDEEPLLVEDRGAVRWIWFNRPRVLNAQNVAMLQALDRALDDVEQSSSVRVLVLGGKGPSFCAGHDLKESGANEQYRSNQATVEGRWRQEWRLFVRPVERIRNLLIPTICRVQGHCLAAAPMFVEACDLVVATPDAIFGSPVMTRMDINDAEIPSFVRSVGVRRAKPILWLGEKLTADDALRYGMVNWVVNEEEIDDYISSVADRLTKVARETLEFSKLSFRFLDSRQGWDDFGAYHFLSHQLSHHSVAAQDRYRERVDGLLDAQNASSVAGSEGQVKGEVTASPRENSR